MRRVCHLVVVLAVALAVCHVVNMAVYCAFYVAHVRITQSIVESVLG
ncbi:Uncharacterised protein [Mycobacteroides abscessus subsp. bolletii]|nr:Uncharacterised protein [Mycobacteroides abscessus subsp. bolletii]SKS81792.1 Uncharacterised protein [Mycobacteroides abscessus subsp. bolletii]